MPYVDGYVLPIPADQVSAYRRIAKKAGEIWREHGALDYKEWVADDLKAEGMVSFTQCAGTKPGETVIFAYVVFKSKAQRDRINAKIINDPRLAGMDPARMPFDCKRIVFGGFKLLVDAAATESA